MEPINIYTAMLLPESDGSGQVKFLGVFTYENDAKAAIYDKLKDQGYWSPSLIAPGTIQLGDMRVENKEGLIGVPFCGTEGCNTPIKRFIDLRGDPYYEHIDEFVTQKTCAHAQP